MDPSLTQRVVKHKPFKSARKPVIALKTSWETGGLASNAIYFVAERRKPSGVITKNTVEKPEGSRSAANKTTYSVHKVNITWLAPELHEETKTNEIQGFLANRV